MANTIRKKANQIRIIGGQWRGRRIDFADTQSLRPTPDRVRETLFNWLAPYLPGTRVLDLFAGSGVLGFEALSRGATSVTAVDNDRTVVSLLESNANKLETKDHQTIYGNAEDFVKSHKGLAFDIVFLDPPFGNANYLELHGLLSESSCVSAMTLLYLESEKSMDKTFGDGNARWEQVKSSKAGRVKFQLLRCNLPEI